VRIAVDARACAASMPRVARMRPLAESIGRVNSVMRRPPSSSTSTIPEASVEIGAKIEVVRFLPSKLALRIDILGVDFVQLARSGGGGGWGWVTVVTTVDDAVGDGCGYCASAPATIHATPAPAISATNIRFTWGSPGSR
jgi:hypothetical protein